MKKRINSKRRPVYRVCPLCEKAFAQARLQAHITKTPLETRRQVINAIREKHPSWTEADGACRRCWESFRGIARVIEFMRRFEFPEIKARPMQTNQTGSEWESYPLPPRKKPRA